MKKNEFVTSDWHIGHLKSIMFDKRPFKDLEQMHETLIRNYNATVGENDICYFLGDIGFGDMAKDVIPKLNGKKICVRGNHDGSTEKMYNTGFDLVVNSIAVVICNELVTMTHCPLRGLYRETAINQDGEDMKNFNEGDHWHGESRHIKYSIQNFDQFHLHGHTHKRKGSDVKYGKQWDIGVVGNNYRPVSFSEIEGWIMKYKRHHDEK